MGRLAPGENNHVVLRAQESHQAFHDGCWVMGSQLLQLAAYMQTRGTIARA